MKTSLPIFVLALFGVIAMATKAEALAVGDRIQATTGLNIRSSASTSSSLLATAAAGAQGVIVGGSTSANGYTWWRVDWDSYSTGWSVEDYMVKVAVSQPGSFSLSYDAPIWDTSPPAGPAVQLRWGTSSNATSYEVYRNGSKIYPSSGTFTGTSFRNETGLTGGQSYSFYIIARNAAGSRQSNTVNITMPNAPPSVPATPGYLEAQFFASRVEMGWTDLSSNEQGFKVERRIGSGSWSQITTVSAASGSGNTLYWTDQTVSPKTSYSYRVRAYNAQGNSAYTNESAGTTPAGKPGGFTLSSQAPVWDASLPGPKVQLTWTASADAGGYALYRDGSLYVSGIAGTSYLNTGGLNAGQTYTYHVRASNSEGTTDSNTITVTMPQAPPSVPATPHSLVAGVSGQAVRLTWTDASNNEQGFKIERRPSWAPGWVALVTLGVNVTSYQDTTVAASESYVYRVRAYNSVGPSNYSNDATVTSAPPAAPGGFTLRYDAPYWDTKAPAGPAVMLRWDAAAGATSYEVFRDGGRIYPAVGASDYTGRTFLNNVSLTPGGTHSFYIVARNAGGSTVSNTVSILMPSSPAGVPQIDSLTPASVTGVPLPDRVGITVRGSNFQPGVRAFVSYSGQSNVQLNATHVQWLDAETVLVRIATSVEPDLWSLYLKNPDNKSSNTKTFQVTAPTGSVTLDQIQPDVTSPSAVPKTFSLTGSGFAPTDYVKLTVGSSVSYVTAPDVQFIGHQTLRFSHAFTQSPATVSVRVVKANGPESGAVTLSVDQSLLPDLTSRPQDMVIEETQVLYGGEIHVSCTIRNIGGATAGTSVARFRLSQDTYLSRDDPGFENMDVQIPAIPANGIYNITGQSFRLPKTLKPGLYHVGLFVDAHDDVKQRSTANDGCLSTERIALVEGPNATVPVFTLHPEVPANYKEGQAINFRAAAEGANHYQMFLDGLPASGPVAADSNGIFSFTLTYPNPGIYGVRAYGLNGVFSDSLPTIMAGSTPAIVEQAEERVLLWSEGGSVINPNYPTVVLVHGWEKNDSYTHGEPPSWYQNIAKTVRARVGSNVNVLVFQWSGAHQPFILYHVATSWIEDAGRRLANELIQKLGENYSQRLHLIGHSLGALVASVASSEMSNRSVWGTVKNNNYFQLTLLDAALEAPDTWTVSRLEKILSKCSIPASIENYYAKGQGFDTGKPIKYTGPEFEGLKIDESLLGSGSDSAHSRLLSVWYQGTINSKSKSFRSGGFQNSIVLNNADGWQSLLKACPWFYSPAWDEYGLEVHFGGLAIEESARTANSTVPVLYQQSGSMVASNDVHDSTERLTFDMTWLRQSPPLADADRRVQASFTTVADQPNAEAAVLAMALTVPASLESLVLSARKIGDTPGGLVSICFAGRPITIMSLDYFDSEAFKKLEVPMSHLRGQTGVLEVRLSNSSHDAASLRIADVRMLHEIDVLAKSNSLLVQVPKIKTRVIDDRVLVTGGWKSDVSLDALTAAVNGGASIPVVPSDQNTWSIELGGLQPGRNTIRIEARTVHGQVISTTREVWRVVKTPFSLAVEGLGAVKGAKLGTSTLEVGQELNLVAVPKNGQVFDRWEGAVTGAFTRTGLIVEPDQTLTAHFVPTPFAGKDGSYTAAISSEDPALAGWLQIKLTSQGGFTGILFIGGQRVAISGGLDSEGRVTLWLPQLEMELRVQIDLEAEVPEVGVTLLSGAEVVAGSTAQRPGYDGRTRIAPQAGSYTVALEPPAEPGLPQGYGYGTVTVSKAGAVKLAGRLPDQTAFSQSAQLDANGLWPLFAQLYSKKGWISGEVLHGDGEVTPEISGHAVWMKPPTKGSYLPEEWTVELGLMGSRYEKPGKGQMVFSELAMDAGDNLTLIWGQGLLETAVQTPGTLDVRHRFTPATPGPQLKLNAGNGLFTGTVLHPLTGKKLSHAGVILQKQQLGYGGVKLVETTALLQLQPFTSEGQVTIKVQITPADAGTVTGQGTYGAGESVQLQTTPAVGFEFMNWLENASEVGTHPKLNFVAAASRNLTAQFAPVTVTSFTDDFNRVNANEVGNGWLNTTSRVDKGWTDGGAVNGTLRIVNQCAENSQTSGTAAIYRGFDHSAGVRVKATFSHVNGFGTLQKRFVHCLGVRSNGQIGDGLAVMFYRADQGYNNSTVLLFDGATEVGKITTDFQFSEWIRAEVEFRTDGSVQVHVANADGTAGLQTLHFPARTVNASGSNVIFVVNGCSGPLKGWVDDVEIESF